MYGLGCLCDVDRCCMWNVVVSYDPIRRVYRPGISRVDANGMIEAEYSGMIFGTRVEAEIEAKIMVRDKLVETGNIV